MSMEENMSRIVCIVCKDKGWAPYNILHLIMYSVACCSTVRVCPREKHRITHHYRQTNLAEQTFSVCLSLVHWFQRNCFDLGSDIALIDESVLLLANDINFSSSSSYTYYSLYTLITVV